jgi:hypothetical protein
MREVDKESALQTEYNNAKHAALTTALGVITVFGAEAIPDHGRQLTLLEISLKLGGLIVATKGVFQLFGALERENEINREP